MQYLDRTLQVKAALLQRADLLEIIRSVLAGYIKGEGDEWRDRFVGSGNTRSAYEAGTCPIEGVGDVVLLLKIFNKRHEDDRTWEGAMGMPYPELGHGSAEEFGAFEAYFDIAAGNIPHIAFRNRYRWRKFRKGLRDDDYRMRRVKMRLPLNGWDGTCVGVGDLGALPYFQMAVKWGEYFGWLTEGLPPVIEPQMTAVERGSDENNIQRGRIIDLSSHHCTLREINKEKAFRDDHPDNLGLIKRGEKYLLPENRLDL